MGQVALQQYWARQGPQGNQRPSIPPDPGNPPGSNPGVANMAAFVAADLAAQPYRGRPTMLLDLPGRFQKVQQRSPLVYLDGSRVRESTSSLVEVPAVAPTMEKSHLYQSPNGYWPYKSMGPFFLPTPIGYEVG